MPKRAAFLNLTVSLLIASLLSSQAGFARGGAPFDCRALLSTRADRLGLSSGELKEGESELVLPPQFYEHFFVLDPQTRRDIAAKQYLIPVIHSPRTPLGSALLCAQLRAIAIDPQEIIARQQAVKELRDEPALRGRIRIAFEEVPEKFRESASNQAVGRVNDIDWSIIAMMSVMSRMFLPMVAFPLVNPSTNPHFIRDALTFMPYPLMFVGMSARMQNHARATVLPIKKLVLLAERLAGILGKSESARLQELGESLSAVTDLNHPDSLAELTARLKRLPEGATATVLDVLCDFGALKIYRDSRLIKKNAESLLKLFAAIGEVDLYMALAEDSIEVEGQSFPEVLASPGPAYLEIAGGHNPFLFGKKDSGSVPNDVLLAPGHSVMLLSGPNAGGKSTHLRMIATLLLKAQLGGAVPAQRMVFRPMGIRTAIGLHDSLADSESRFQAEAAQTARILNGIRGPVPVLNLLDEMLVGTNAREGGALRQAVISDLANSSSLAVVATHDVETLGLEGAIPGVFNRNVVFDQSEDGSLTPTYRVKDGRTRITNALDVAEKMGFPREVVDQARKILANGR